MQKRVISIVIPAKNEEENILPLYKQIITSLKKVTNKYEIIFIDDGSVDNTFKNMLSLRKKDKAVKIIKHRGNWGKSTALQNGFDIAGGEIVITMDADLQDDPVEISRFIAKLDQGYDLVSGWKKHRHDASSTVIPSRILNNFLIPLLTGVKIHDTNCGFKAYKKQVTKNLNLYGELYRFIPILASKQNFKVGEIPVKHHARIHGKSKFGWQKNYKGLLDLITIVFLTGYLRRPAHFFGTFGFVSLGFGFIIGLYITYLRFTTGGIGYHQPLLMLGILLLMIGVQLITTGLIAEMLTNFNQRKKSNENLIDQQII